VKHAVRSTFATLLVGVFGQRLLQLISFLCIGRALDAERLGIYAQGTAVAALLGVLAGAGVRNLLTRAVTHDPAAAGNLLLTAIRTRLAIGATLAAIGIAIAFAATEAPWFWTLCLLQVVPGAFDLKNLLDAAGRTRAEVLLESGTALLQLLLVLGWLLAGGHDLVELAAISLAARCAYALLALPAIRRIPADVVDPTRAALSLSMPGLRTGFAVALAEGLHGILTAGDIWFVALCFGNGAAGYYAVATRFAGAALLPSTQLARLLLPHLLHAGAAGDAGRTLGTASRATLLVTLPMLAGGAAVAERLCMLPGAAFAAAAPALVLALLSGCLQHSGWQQSHALLAAGRFGAYARGLAGPGLLHVSLLVAGALLLGRGGGYLGDPTEAMLAAGIAVLANAFYYLAGARAVRDLRPGQDVPIGGAVRVAFATGVAAALPALCCDGKIVLPLQLFAGGLAFAGSLWLVELRGRMARLGDGLAQASGFRA
jgi:O-antigen/teichoic acid export membrane protein